MLSLWEFGLSSNVEFSVFWWKYGVLYEPSVGAWCGTGNSTTDGLWNLCWPYECTWRAGSLHGGRSQLRSNFFKIHRTACVLSITECMWTRIRIEIRCQGQHDGVSVKSNLFWTPFATTMPCTTNVSNVRMTIPMLPISNIHLEMDTNTYAFVVVVVLTTSHRDSQN